jgi:DUF971 family protein
MSALEPPTGIRAQQAEQVLELTWTDGRADRLPYHHIRANCPCASCRDEWTGARILDAATIRPDLRIEGLEGVGSYAVRIVWNDGHGSGLYTWEQLRDLAGSAGAGGRWSGIDPPAPGGGSGA